MYVDSKERGCKNGKVTAHHLLRRSYRESGKVMKETIANISHLSNVEIANLKLALASKEPLTDLVSLKDVVSNEQGVPIGAVLALKSLSDRLGITKALGISNDAKLALWQVLARVIERGSRLSATRLAKSHAADKLLDIVPFNEDDLYRNLKWICDNQEEIEDRLHKLRRKKRGRKKETEVFLYDVTSSYFEGVENVMAFFGYNRDGKKGKMQIVIGLLCDKNGFPLSVEVFDGNTKDHATVACQIRKISKRFGGSEVVFVGDRGMIKSQQVEDLLDNEMHYITGITKPQIRKLLKDEVVQMNMFDLELCEIEDGDVRYILRKNPVRAKETAASRNSKYQSLIEKVEKRNKYLFEHAGASTDVALRDITAYAQKLKVDKWVAVRKDGRSIKVGKNEGELSETAKLDGCYVLKTDLKKEDADKETVHSRYKDLAEVEKAFRTFKQDFLEVHPTYVRTEASTRGHVFVVMLAYIICRELKELWRHIELTVEEGIRELNHLCSLNVYVRGIFTHSEVPQPNPQTRELLEAAGIELPRSIRRLKSEVDTRKTLVAER